MRHRRTCACAPLLLAAALASACVAAGGLPVHNLTIVIEFDGTPSEPSVAEMEQELERIYREAGTQVSFRTRDQVQGGVASDLVLVRFRGRCMMDRTPPPLYDESGPLAWTRVVEGAPSSFGEVNCDMVRKAVLSALWGQDYGRQELLFGRALGRVLAHEVYHMMAKTLHHGSTGVTEPALSGAQLIADSLDLDEPSASAVQSAGR